MSRRQQSQGLAILFALLAGLGYAALKMTTSAHAVCQACSRAVHRDMKTVALVGDRRDIFCCPTCALSQGAQLRKPVRFEQLSDFASGKPLLPENAFAVEGSDLVPCVRAHEALDHMGQPAERTFDRCSPSIVAFADRAAAERFAAEHGGRVDTFNHLIQASGALLR